MRISDSGTLSHPGLLALGIFIIGAVFNLGNWSLSFSGDAGIHLVFAEELLQGCFLCFNPGEVSGGETSMGYMLLVALLAKLFSLTYAPLAMKAVGVFSLLGLAWGIYALSRKLGSGAFWALMAALASLNLVGSVSQGMSGTENALFGALFICWICHLVSSGFFTPSERINLRAEAITGGFAGAMLWIRPEIAPCFALALVARAILVLPGKPADFPARISRLAIGSAVSLGCFAGPVTAYVLIYYGVVGELPYGAGAIRRLLSVLRDSVQIGPLAINMKALKRLIIYAPLVVGPAIAFLLARGKGRRSDPTVIGLTAVFFGALCLYVFNVLPVFHFARYTLYLWPVALALSAWAVTTLVKDGSNWTLSLGAALVSFVVAASVLETSQRLVTQGSLIEVLVKTKKSDEPRFQITRAMANPLVRPDYSSALLTRLQSTGPTTISLQEVQLRRKLDDRFIVRAYDGVTDPVLKRYIHAGYFDHDGYLIDQKVDFVLSPVNYNTSKTAWSVAHMARLETGSSVARPGVRYTLVAPDIVKVERLVAQASERRLTAEEISLFKRPPLP